MRKIEHAPWRKVSSIFGNNILDKLELPRRVMKNNVSVALGLCFGLALGTLMGVALHHSGTGMVFGAALGLLIGSLISIRKKSLN